MWEVTEAGVMKAYLRPEDRTLCVCGGGESRVPGFLAKAKHQADNYSESELLASLSFHCFPLLYRISSPCPHLSSLKQERRAGLSKAFLYPASEDQRVISSQLPISVSSLEI